MSDLLAITPSLTNIALIGLPGAGKTTIGRQLARKTNRSFIDSDQFIESLMGCSIMEFFEREGEDVFRKIERQAIDDLTNRERSIISTGGGAILDADNRQNLSSRCTCIYLRSTPDDLYRRLRHDRKRPLLRAADPMETLTRLYEIRDPLYRQVATFVIDTGRPSVSTLLNTILTQLEPTDILNKTE